MATRLSAATLVFLLLLSMLSDSAPTTGTSPGSADGVIRLPSTASIWLADTTARERNSSAGRFALFKLKSIQEMAAIRFDASAVKGREVLSARLFLHAAGATLIRYLRV